MIDPTDIDFSKLNAFQKFLVLALSGLVGFLGLGKYRVAAARDSTAVAGEGAEQSQFKALQESIAQMQATYTAELGRVNANYARAIEDIAKMRSEQSSQHDTINRLQVRLTRLRTVVVRLNGIIVDAGHAVPPHIVTEIEYLVGDHHEPDHP